MAKNEGLKPRYDAVIQFQAGMEHNEVHGSIAIQQQLDAAWDQHCRNWATQRNNPKRFSFWARRLAIMPSLER